ncbi:hypothetical protein L7F22_009961 [Adiantum nelumboides]|nr:hypothetical protein [Adiantum nelumboides]
MDWRAKNISTNGVMRVPSNCLAFKHINLKWPEFKQEPRNLKMDVGLDGVNPFSMHLSKWSTWPVVLVNYNLPPFICFKKEHLILSLIIPGKRQVKDLNVYLAPLIDDLLELWRGIDMLDMSKQNYGRKFRVRGILAWTIRDFPGYGYCAGCSTKGYKACPICDDWLKSTYRRSTLTLSISIWFQLEYWKDLKIFHLLNPMHIFKNVGHSLWKNLTSLKDTEQARNDLKERNCKSNLWPQVDEELGRKEYAHVPWVLTPTEIATINRRIRSIQTPTGYGASLQNIFTMYDSSLSNLKTHDWHNFLKVHLYFVLVYIYVLKNVSYNAQLFFRWTTSKEIDISSIAQKKRECIELLCLMEKELPTSSFDIQVHVLIHLVDEIEIAGVVSTYWMFWVERFMGVLKGRVRQRARLEGSMSEGWVLGECMYYLAEYLEHIDEGALCKWTLDEPTILSDEILCGKGICFKVSYEERTNLSTFVIYNSQCIEKFVKSTMKLFPMHKEDGEEENLAKQNHSQFLDGYPTLLKIES